MQLTTGARVLARGLIWDVLERENLGAQQRLRLRCLATDLRGLEWDLLHPREKVRLLRDELDPRRPGTLAGWRLFHQACLLDRIPGPEELAAACPGRLRIEPYQLVPLMRALEMPRARLLLADGVGLGKTIEAGLIAAELIARRRAHRILIAAPAGPLLHQWEQEMRQRFGLRFTVLADATALRDERRKLPLGGNPFTATAFVLTSLDFAKQETVLEEVERAAWDLVIIDEAHHCVSAATTTARDDTLRRRLAEVLARQSDALLLLTATPHDGYDPHFASLIALLDPSLVDGAGGLAGLAYRRHVVRRLKSHILDAGTGGPLFRARRVTPVPITTDDPAVRRFHRALSALVTPRLRRGTQDRGLADALAFVSLLKRSVSTIAACLGTLRVVAGRYASLTDGPEPEAARRERVRTLRACRKRALRYGVLDAPGESDLARLEAEDIAADLRANGDTEAALRGLIALGEAAAPADPKLAALLTEIRLIRAGAPRANVLVYTEYADSQDAAAAALRAAPGLAGEILTIGGQDSDEARTRAAERCAEEDGLVLISTDSLAEGLNLQQRCHHLIHLDLPYNPNRLEQRNGRIDRYGQTREPDIRYLCLAGTFEERLLLRLIAKYEKARARLTFMPDTLGMTVEADRLGDGLLTGLAEEQASLFPEDAPPIRTIDVAATEAGTEAYRDLLREIDRAYEGFEGMAARHGWLDGQGREAAATAMARAGGAATAMARAGGAATRQMAAIDLVGFVAGALAGAAEGSDPILEVPAEWARALDGLPGYDAGENRLRLTRDLGRSRDADGRAVAMPGRVHPVVRKSIGRLRHARAASVSVARHDTDALLLTYGIEVRSQFHTEFEQVIAVLLERQGPAVALADPQEWLRFADPAQETACPDAWARFAPWAPGREVDAEAAARDCMRALAADFAQRHAAMLDDERARLERWLERRTDTICGARQAAPADLFGTPLAGPAWRHAVRPLDRLAGFAADPANAAAVRREADGAVTLFQRRAGDTPVLAPPTLHRLGLLMLVAA